MRLNRSAVLPQIYLGVIYMKMNFVLAVVFSLFMLAISVSAQKTTDFTGTWNLDVSKSKPAERGVESQTFVVTQTATDIKVDRTTKRPPPPADAPAGGGGRGGMMGGGDGSTTYTLDGKGVDSEMQGPMGSMKVTTKAKIDGGKLEITRAISTPMGERASTEKWWLNTDGTLTIESQRPNREGGTDTTTRIYTKKS